MGIIDKMDKKRRKKDSMFQIAICDDDKLFCEQFINCLNTAIKKLRIECSFLVWQEGGELIEYLVKKNQVDLLFLDIELEESNGVNLGKFIREELLDFQTQLVYVSHEQGYAMQLFETEPMDFLVKPVEQEQIEKVLQRFLKQQASMGRVFTYRNVHGNVQIPYASIWYFQSMNHKIVIHTIDEQKEFSGKLTDIENMAPDYFVRIHKSYLVNEFFVKRFHYDKVILRNNQKLTISKTYRSMVQDRISQCMGEI